MDIAVIFSAIECGGDDWHWAGGAGPEDAWSVGNVMSGLAGIVCRLGWGGPGARCIAIEPDFGLVLG